MIYISMLISSRSNATVEELAEMACKHMKIKIFGENRQKIQEETDQQSSSSMPDVLLLDNSVDSAATRRGQVKTTIARLTIKLMVYWILYVYV